MDRDVLRRMLEKAFPVDVDSPDFDPGATYRGTAGNLPVTDTDIAWRSRSSSGLGGSAKTDGEHPMPGEVGGYRIVEKLAAGGMGEVFRAWQGSLMREVAVKRLKPSRREEGEENAFVAEALATGFLDHPNIVPVHDLIETAEGEPAIAMKLVGGTSWRDILHPTEPHHEALAREFTVERHIEILIAVCNAAAYAHSKGIIHRDLKPSNVMVGSFGEVYLMDWGMAVSFDRRGAETMHAPARETITEPSGTPGYLAPEMAEARGRDLGPWTDVYLLGASLHEVLTGEPPHQGRSILQIVASASQSRPAKYPEHVPAELQAICRKAMSRLIKDRFKSVEEFQQALRDYLACRESRMIERDADMRMERCRGARLERRLKTEGERMRAYNDLAEALAGYRQAMLLWEDNDAAASKEEEVRRVYAGAALSTGDLALARAQLEGLEGDDVDELEFLISEAEGGRERTARSMKRLRMGVLSVASLLIVGLGVGFIIVSQEKARANENALEADRQAREARHNLTLAQTSAREARESEGRAQQMATHARNTAEEKSKALVALEVEKERADQNARLARDEARRNEALRVKAEEAAKQARENFERAIASARKANRAELEARNASDRADSEEDLKRQAQEELRRLADLQLLQRRIKSGKSLLDDPEGDVAAMQSLLHDVDDLLLRRNDHERALVELLHRAALAHDASSATARNLETVLGHYDDIDRWMILDADDEDGKIKRTRGQIRSLMKKIGQSAELSYVNDDERWHAEMLDELVAGLAEVTTPKRGLLARLRSRLSESLEGDALAAGRFAKEWKRVVRAVGGDRRFKGVEISPMAGFVPLGRNPKTRLFEFLHLPSHHGPMPRRKSDGEFAVDGRTGMIFVLLPGGRFSMGAQSEKKSTKNYFPGAAETESPVHAVRLRPFFIAKHEMTQGQWRRLFETNPSFHSDESDANDAHPVESVSWHEARRVRSVGFELPTEAQWEYAGRGGSATPWYTGATRKDVAHAGNLADSSWASVGAPRQGMALESWSDGHSIHAPVGSFRPNKFGLFDVIGNVREWCLDGFGTYETPIDPGSGRRQVKAAATRVVRGGAFLDVANDARSSARRSAPPDLTDRCIGVRPVVLFDDRPISAVSWDAVKREISSSPRYGRLRIDETSGLLPLGRDPDSSLHEFLHVASHEGEIPVRDAQGRLPLTDATGIIFVLLPPGEVRMGAQATKKSGPGYDPAATSVEGPVTRVRLKAFYIAKHEITQAQWVRLNGDNPSQLKLGSRHPMENVSWDDCLAQERHGLLIPTEAQWEYATRAGKRTPWWTGAEAASIDGAGNVSDADHDGPDRESWSDGFRQHAPVGSFKPNPFGLHDVIGNLWEWCRDPWSGYDRPAKGTDGLRQGGSPDERACRGGCYGDPAVEARSSVRLPRARNYKDAWIGFRPVRGMKGK